MKTKYTIPEQGIAGAKLIAMLDDHKSDDAAWSQGKTFGFVYHPGEQKAKLSEEYQAAFQYESTLNPSAFPSLRKFEKEVLGMARDLMHGGPRVAGSISTGGTESIFLALKVARDMAMERGVKETAFEVLLPATAHPAFLKACHYLSLKPVLVPVDVNGRALPEAMQDAISSRTILMAASAPCFPYGVVDPVQQLGALALKHRLLFHVDACMGGFMLPFMEELGYEVPVFDFRVPGVTSISLDAHKYGYAPKGCSILLYRNRKLRKKQFFIHTEWSGGIFASTTFMGTKSGGPLAGCWAIMNHLGRKGYREIVKEVMLTSLRIREGISAIDGLEIVGDPDMSLLAFTSRAGNIFNIGDALSRKGWYLDRLQFPDALHLTITRLNIGMEEEFLKDLAGVLGEQEDLMKEYKATLVSVKVADTLTRILPSAMVDHLSRWAGGMMSMAGEGSKVPQAALYGMSSSGRNRKNIRKLVTNLLDGMY
jgi:glutamate/tyrosine decarboxylase-like PLP-dependent enzyme